MNRRMSLNGQEMKENRPEDLTSRGTMELVSKFSTQGGRKGREERKAGFFSVRSFNHSYLFILALKSLAWISLAEL